MGITQIVIKTSRPSQNLEPKQSHSQQITRVSKSADKYSSSVLVPECIFAGKKRAKFKGKWYELGKAETFNAEMNIRNAAKGLNDQELLRKIVLMILVLAQISKLWRRNIIINARKSISTNLVLNVAKKKVVAKIRKPKGLHLVIL